MYMREGPSIFFLNCKFAINRYKRDLVLFFLRFFLLATTCTYVHTI